MEQLCQEFERYARAGHELGVQVSIEGERYEWHFTGAFGKAAESDSVRIFKSLACRAAARRPGGPAGPEGWKLWLRDLCDADPNFRIMGDSILVLSEQQFNLLKESGEPTEGYVYETVEFTETHLIECARWIHSNQVDPSADFDRFVGLGRAAGELRQKGNEHKMPRVGDFIARYIYKVQRGQLLGIFNASAIRCMELGTSLAASVKKQHCLGARRGSRSHSRSKDDQLETTRELVRQMKKEGVSQWEMCKRLGDHPRPPHASWRNLSWSKAYQENNSAVKKWLSDAAK